MTRDTVGWCLMAFVLTGCGGTDMSDYRPVSNVHKAVRPTADSNPVNDSVSSVASADENEPALVEVDLPVSALRPLNVIDGSKVSNLLKGNPSAEVPAIQPVSATVAEEPRKVELLIPEKTFQRDNASKALRVSYDDLDLLKVLNLEPVTSNAVELMPTWLRELSGQRIRIRGFMYPTFVDEGIERFVLARDNQICCFGRDPKVYDLVQVDLRAGKSTHYISPQRSFDVVGTFKIDLEIIDGKPFGLYYIDNAEIIER